MLEIIYLIYIAFRFGFLAKRYSKNVILWIIYSAIFYIISILAIGFNIRIFSAMDLMPKLEELSEESLMWIPVIAGLFVAIIVYRIVEKSFKKDLKFEVEEQMLEKAVPTKFTLPGVYYHFHRVNESNIHHIKPLAEKIWEATYSSILSKEQMDYMIPMMYADEKILSEIENGFHWEILKVDNVAVGYVDYKLEEDQRVFLSKIYLDTTNQQKGLGRLMLEHIIDFAKDKNAKAIYLTVNKNNQKAINFYERNHFKKINSQVFDIGNGYVMDDYVYELSF